ncbi:hypothetical protein D8Y22_04035 [Salinadaptatus halalkaliphilus]|uniref:Uncharacterized protein n=1 Tax=Salinadaptatus halalkaliphilus TaxID=2419781 RepID=A0A4S3TR39_9EURY|nr:hypothetical protein [Salinadaptatus halalkaliphilus]THE66100.1 hypothetical protein D8Y22_04035 [Salinadaptatus halalkaliphilus]
MSTTHSRTIARVELRRRFRALQEDAAQLIAITLVVLMFVPFSLIGLLGVLVFGMEVGSGGLETPLELVRMGAVYGWLFVAGFGGYRAYATALRPDRLDGLLTTVSHRDLFGGLVLAELLLWGIPLGLISVGAAFAFAAGSGSMVAVPFVLLTIWTAFGTAFATGLGLALGVMNTGVRSALVARLRTVVVLCLGIAYVGVIFTQNVGAVLDPLYWLLEPTPISWYADLALLGTATAASPARGGGVLLASALFLAASSVALSRLAAWLWYADGISIEREAATAAPTDRQSRLSRVFSQPVVGVVLADWKRARREPIALSFVLYPLVLLAGPTITLIQTGTVTGTFPLLIVLCGTWITGVLFTLNVVGNEGAVLPATVLSPGAGRSLVVGHVVAGALVGVPATVVATVLFGLLAPHSIAVVATLAASGIVLAGCAGPIATGIGAVVPRFQAVSVSRSTKAIVPSLLAFAIYSVTIALLALPTMLVHTFVGQELASLIGTSQVVVTASTVVLTALVAAPLAVLSARYAIRSVEAFHFE